ncbi:MAG: hypothetical protein QNJ98_14360 [Planctomycetota bacterium]|nr:hypothetical protein [Planctomycetota bacterium]
MVRRPDTDLGDTLPAVVSDVERARSAALDQLRAAGLGMPDATGLPRPAFLDEMPPKELAQLLLAALGRGDHGDREKNPIYALYQVALDFRTAAEGYRSLIEIDGAPGDRSVG